MEPLSFFLSTFTALADRIINLEKTKLQNKQTLLNEIVKPLFEELEPIALDYMFFYKKTQKMLLNKKSKLQQVADQVKEDRDQRLMVRIKIREMARQISQEIKDKDITEFAEAIVGLFYTEPTVVIHPENLSDSFKVVSMFDLALEEGLTKENLSKYIAALLNQIEFKWALVVQRYEKLKIYSISPPKFIRKSKK